MNVWSQGPEAPFRDGSISVIKAGEARFSCYMITELFTKSWEERDEMEQVTAISTGKRAIFPKLLLKGNLLFMVYNSLWQI